MSEELSQEALYSMSSDLESLSNRFGSTERNVEGTLISNDEGFKEIIPGIKETIGDKEGGVGLFIGSGGAISLLPDLPIDISLIVDKNPAVLELNQLIASLIQEEESPESVIDKLRNPETAQILEDINQVPGNLDLMMAYITHGEPNQFGEYHWTNPNRFNQVKKALREKPMIFVVADVTDDGFAEGLTATLTRYQEYIRFANFTNVHSWIRDRPMDFIRKWPLDTNATIVYSSNEGGLVGDSPKVRMTHSLEDYIQITSSEKP